MQPADTTIGFSGGAVTVPARRDGLSSDASPHCLSKTCWESMRIPVVDVSAAITPQKSSTRRTNLPLRRHQKLRRGNKRGLQFVLSQCIQRSIGGEGYFGPSLPDCRTVLFGKTTAPSKGTPCTRTRNSRSGTMNSVEPHAKQTASFGNTHTIGLSKPLSPEKWIAISPLNEL